MMSPALENRRSLATEVAGTLNKLCVMLAMFGYFAWLSTHQHRGHTVWEMEGEGDAEECNSATFIIATTTVALACQKTTATD